MVSSSKCNNGLCHRSSALLVTWVAFKSTLDLKNMIGNIVNQLNFSLKNHKIKALQGKRTQINKTRIFENGTLTLIFKKLSAKGNSGFN